MNYTEKFEDEGFVYELVVHPSADEVDNLNVESQGNGFSCHWLIIGKKSRQIREVTVTDDNCDIIVFHSVEAAVKGAKDFLSIS